MSMVRSLRSQSSDFAMSDLCIHGWSKICSRVGLSEGLKERHHLISCWHSGECREKEGLEEGREGKPHSEEEGWLKGGDVGSGINAYQVKFAS